MKKRLLLPIGLTITGMLLAACGVDPGSGVTVTPTPQPTSTPTPHATPTQAVFDAQCVMTEAFPTELIRAVIGKDELPTAYDPINVGGCDFTKPVVKVSVTIEGPGIREVIDIQLPTPMTQLGFPLPDEIDVPVLHSSLLPGEYTRTVVVYTAEGESKELSGFRPIELVQSHEEAQANLDAAKARWEQAGVRSYRFTARWQCFCITEWVAPVVVEVREGEVISVTFAEAEQTGEVPNPERFGTVERMFEHVQSAIDEGAAQITAEYDGALGYPTNVFIDYHALMADEEQGFAITDFETL